MKFQQSTKRTHPGLWQSRNESLADVQQTETRSASDAIEAAKQCQSEQWITVVGGSREFIAQLVAGGIPSQRIRWLRTRNQTQREWALEQALLTGTSGLVVGWLDHIDSRLNQRMKMASRLSRSQCFLFEEDTLLPHLH